MSGDGKLIDGGGFSLMSAIQGLNLVGQPLQRLPRLACLQCPTATL